MATQTYGEFRPGDAMVDQNGDNSESEHDVVRVWDILPTAEVYYGFNVGLSYQGFDLNAHFQELANRSIYLNVIIYAPLKNKYQYFNLVSERKCTLTPETAGTANLPRLYQKLILTSTSSDVWKVGQR